MKFLLFISLLLALNISSANAELFGKAEVVDDGSELYKHIKADSLKDWRKISHQYKRAIASGGQAANDFRGDILKLRGKTKAQTIYNVNKYVNAKITYRSDKEVWGEGEYWANPIETTGKGSYGDCDDYALAKYFALKQLGFRDNHLTFAAVMSSGGGHAVLVVKDAKESYILDNNLRNPVPEGQINFYDPIYTVNNNSFKLYKELPKPSKTAAERN